jgi:DNA repair exonuclease SbcCD ATPase subunit
MITFESITYKNFLSVGNNPITIDLNSGHSTLIVGSNGEGKSTLLDALSFGLFGKPHRAINKPQLVNSINEKHCEVTVTFSIGADSYTVIRGMKPNKFEIWQNGEMLNQDSKAKDYQKILESSILKLNHKSFHQIVVLGSSNFTPFMQLSAQNRREVIEDLLDIRIFSKMNALLKDRKVSIRDTLRSIQTEGEFLSEKIIMTKKHLRELENIKESDREKVFKKCKDLAADLKNLEEECKALNEDLKNMPRNDSEKTVAKKKKLYGYEGTIKSKIEKLKNEEEFFTQNDTCPTCSQDITAETKDSILAKVNTSLQELTDGYQSLQEEIVRVEQEYEDVLSQAKRLQEVSGKIQYQNQVIAMKRKELDSKSKELQALQTTDNNTAEYQKTLKSLQAKAEENDQERIAYQKESNHCALAEELLKDSGIKTKIIQQYIPVMNKLINEYLSVFDFFVSFTIDESFEERIRSRHRDDFSYSSFSEGEKAKIDLSLLLTWRKIAEMKNSTNTNLLIMDEVFDGSLDEAGSESLMNLFRTFSNDTSIFVISHKTDVWQDKFDRVFRFRKENNFSVCDKA